MIKCIAGKKGSGKTKMLIDMVNEAVNSEKGNVICIEKGLKLTYDLNHNARLIETDIYGISGYDMFYGFICGIYAGNYDVSNVFIDSLYKITDCEDSDKIDAFMEKLEHFSRENRVKFVITVSADIENLPENIKKYL